MAIDKSANTVTKESLKIALRYVDKPFIDDVWDITIKSGEKTDSGISNASFLGHYLKNINMYAKYRDLTFASTVDIEIEKEKIMNSKIETEKEVIVTDSMKLFWGRNAMLTNQDYIDLQTKFDNYVRYDSELDPKKEQDYRQLCIYELQRDKMQFNVDKESVNMVKTYQTMINELSDNLGIQAIQKKEEIGSEKLIIGLVTRYIEDVKKRPIPRYVEDLGGEDKLRELVGVEYVGGLCESIGAKNNKKKEYDALMKDSTVQPHELLNNIDQEEEDD